MIATIDIRALRAELIDSGAFDHRTARTWVKLALLWTALACLLALVALLPWWCAFAVIPLAAVPATTAAMIGHEAGHGSLSASRRHNEIALHLLFPIFCGLGAQHWRHKHNHLHHASPNVVGRDPDLEIWPMALSSAAHAASGPARRWMQRTMQGYLFWPLTLLLSFTMRWESIGFVVRRAREGRVDRALLLDLACLVAHYALWLALPMVWFGPWQVLVVYTGLWAVVGLYLALIFAPAHIALPLAVHGDRGGWDQQLEATCNLRMSRWLGWFFIGLQHQVEHHLFPRIPHQNLPQASRIVARWCARLDAPYRQIDYLTSIGHVTRHMHHAWRSAPPAANMTGP